MKAKINIEIFDDSSLEQCESFGFYNDTLKTLYTISFDTLLKEICEDGTNYNLSVEIEDNTVN